MRESPTNPKLKFPKLLIPQTSLRQKKQNKNNNNSKMYLNPSSHLASALNVDAERGGKNMKKKPGPVPDANLRRADAIRSAEIIAKRDVHLGLTHKARCPAVPKLALAAFSSFLGLFLKRSKSLFKCCGLPEKPRTDSLVCLYLVFCVCVCVCVCAFLLCLENEMFWRLALTW